MTRPWGQLHASTLTHRKYLKSSHEERSAWLTLLLWSFNNPNDDALGDRADVEATLKTLGGHRRAAVLLDRLIAIGWVDDGPCLRLHDWQSWQPEDPTGAKRKQAERARNWGEPVETVTGASRDSSVTVTQLGEERRGEENQERRGEPVSGPDAYCCLTLRFPRPGTPAYEWTTRLAEEFGLAEFNRAMTQEWAKSRTVHTLLSRTEAALSRDGYRLDCAERDAERERNAAKRAAVRPIIDPTICLRCGAGELLDNPLITGGAFGSYHRDKCSASEVTP
jgi:hypothetical protein